VLLSFSNFSQLQIIPSESTIVQIYNNNNLFSLYKEIPKSTYLFLSLTSHLDSRFVNLDSWSSPDVVGTLAELYG
jgi:hypothetical protein